MMGSMEIMTQAQLMTMARSVFVQISLVEMMVQVRLLFALVIMMRLLLKLARIYPNA